MAATPIHVPHPVDVQTFLKVLGKELGSLRRRRRWSREEVIRRLADGISLQTLATYEQGTRQCSVIRLIQLCDVLGEPAHHMLERVSDRTRPVDTAGGLHVNLDRIAVDHRPQLLPLRRWAQDRLRRIQRHDELRTTLSRSALVAMAELCEMTTTELATALLDMHTTPSQIRHGSQRAAG